MVFYDEAAVSDSHQKLLQEVSRGVDLYYAVLMLDSCYRSMECSGHQLVA
jgi:hypothetical protein